jgi:predicted transcriptional regulator
MSGIHSHEAVAAVRTALMERKALLMQRLGSLRQEAMNLESLLAEVDQGLESISHIAGVFSRSMSVNDMRRITSTDRLSAASMEAMQAVHEIIIAHPRISLKEIDKHLPFPTSDIVNAVEFLLQTGMIQSQETQDGSRYTAIDPIQRRGVTEVILETLKNRRSPVRLEELKAAVGAQAATSGENLSEKVSATLSGLVNRGAVVRTGTATYVLSEFAESDALKRG